MPAFPRSVLSFLSDCGRNDRHFLDLQGRLAECYNAHVHQIVFNEISASELSAIPTLDQLELINSFQVDGEKMKDGQAKDAPFGVVERDGRRIFRYRCKDYRIYFIMEDDKVVVQRVLHTNSLRDFLFRSGMGGSEDQRLSESRSFWRLIDEGEKAARK